MKNATDFAQIGGSIVPGWGHAIGFVAGGISGAITTEGWKEDKLNEDNRLAQAEIDKVKKERMDNYFNNNNANQINKQYNVMRKALGYSQNS